MKLRRSDSLVTSGPGDRMDGLEHRAPLTASGARKGSTPGDFSALQCITYMLEAAGGNEALESRNLKTWVRTEVSIHTENPEDFAVDANLQR